MSVSDQHPYHSVSDDELHCLIYSDLVNINYLSGNDPNNIIFNVFHHSQGTRVNHLNLICSQARTSLYKFSIHCVGPKVWKILSDEIRNFRNFNIFKSKMKKFLFNSLSQN